MLDFNQNNDPNPSKFLESYRYLGYSNYSAIADIVDNSFDAEADNVWITTQKLEDENFVITISDDGSGMDRATLEQAYRLGALVERNPEKDLGKFGVGSASASLSLARKTTVITKAEESAPLTKVVDLDHMISKNTFDVYLSEAKSEAVKLLSEMCDGAPTCTSVILEKCDNIRSKTNITQFNNQLRKHIGQTFRIFLSAGKRIFINDKLVPSIDPLLVDGFVFKNERYETKILSDDWYDIKIWDNDESRDEKIRIRIVLLPDLERKLWGEKWPKDVAKPSLQSQGFYVMRNNREIASAERLDLFTGHNDYNRFRAEIFFTGTMDVCMGVNFTKRKIELTQSIYDQLKTYLKDQLETIRRMLKRERAVKEKDANESFRESEEVIERKKMLLIKRKRTEEEIKKEIEAQKRKHPKRTTEEIAKEQQKFLDEAGKPKDCHFDVANLGKTGSFFETEKIGHTLIIRYNIDHPFYQKFYSEKDRSTQNDLNFLVYSFCLAKRNLTDEQITWSDQMEGLWSLNLKALLE